GTNGESVTHFASPKSSTATTQIPEWTLTNSIFVVDQDTFQGDGGATVKTWITDGALIDPYFANNLAITPAGTMFNTASPANLPSSGPGAPNGSVGAVGNTLTANLAALNTTLGMVSYSGCVTPDPSPGDSASLPNCIITGSHAAQGPNIAQIQAHQSLGNDTTLWGPRSPW
ncbi:MAG TPA: hypothetical protein VKB26_05615, partial [Candidatus Acidoferrales bacterium]|nr:hypothetical protein [Candidatus Acidoferrales bacterium]